MGRLANAALLLGCLTTGCEAPASPQSPTPLHPTAAELPRADTASTSASLAPVPITSPKGVTLVFTEIRGLSAERTGLLFAPTQDAVENCRKSAGGKVVVRLRAEGGTLVPTVAPGSSLNPLEQRCVLEALSQTHIDEAGSLSSGAAIKPSGFTSILTIEW